MPDPTPTPSARDREALIRACEERFKDAQWTSSMWASGLEGFLAGAAHGRAEADAHPLSDAKQLRAALERERQNSASLEKLRVMAHSDLAAIRAELERVRAARDEARKQLKAAEVQIEVLHRMCEEWEDGRRTRSDTPTPRHDSDNLGAYQRGWTDAQLFAQRPASAVTELERKVVDEARAALNRTRRGSVIDANLSELSAALRALDAATPKPNPVREAVGRLRAWVADHDGETISGVNTAALRTVLDALDAEGGE